MTITLSTLAQFQLFNISMLNHWSLVYIFIHWKVFSIQYFCVFVLNWPYLFQRSFFCFIKFVPKHHFYLVMDHWWFCRIYICYILCTHIASLYLWCCSNTLFKTVDRNQKIAFVVSHCKLYVQISLNTWIANYSDVTVFENHLGSHNLWSVNPNIEETCN